MHNSYQSFISKSLNKSQRWCFSAKASLLLAMLPLTVMVAPSPSFAQTTDPVACRASEYIKNRFQLPSYVFTDPQLDYASSWQLTLSSLGYRKITTPQVGSIVILNAYFPGTGAKGYIGAVQAIKPTGKFDIRGASQAGTPFTEYGCNNVSVTVSGASYYGRTDLSFWLPPL
ncbi:MAG TPA: hypothetical protein VK203_02575 [Nostocaceae cyanobacterium]|nr:hypothetical protein [Nostocaceae cyanobacterium]